jgi:hypothetical protein
MPSSDVGKMLLDFPNMVVWIITMLESPKNIRAGPEFEYLLCGKANVKKDIIYDSPSQ